MFLLLPFIMVFLTLIQPMIHYGLHFVFPVVLAYIFCSKNWKQVSVVLLATMTVDLDHLFADPIFYSNRCSIGFHILHQYWAIGLYMLMLFFQKTRIVGIGLLLHMVTDFIDCWMMNLS